MPTFSDIYDAHDMRNKSLACIARDNTLRALCPGWWRSLGGKIVAAKATAHDHRVEAGRKGGKAKGENYAAARS